MLAFVLPVFIGRLLWRSRTNTSYRRRMRERFGFVPRQSNLAIWVQAVSVGEVVAVAPLVRALQQRMPRYEVVLTTTTPTGSAEAVRLLGDTVLHYYFPYDMVSFIQRFVRRLSIKACITVESEIWPNLIHTLHREGVPLFLVNARLSAKSQKKYEKWSHFALPILSRYRHIIARDQHDYDAFSRVGVSPEQLSMGGNIKYDLQYSEAEIEKGNQWRDLLGSRPVWIAASTHPGEEALLLQSHAKLIETIPGVCLVLVPRHPERVKDVVRLLHEHNLSFVLRSESVGMIEASVLVVDTIGELRAFFVASDIVFMGGSLVPIGGHNFLEPALLSKPLLSGPHLTNFTEMSAKLIANQGLIVIHDKDQLCSKIEEWILEPALSQRVGKQAHRIFDHNKGAIQRHISIIESHLD